MNDVDELKASHGSGTTIGVDDSINDKKVGKLIKIKLKKKYWKRVSIIVASVILLLATAVTVYANYTLNGIKHEKEEDIVINEEEFEVDSYEVLENVEPEETELEWSDLGYDAASMDGVTNILLCGEEAMEESKVGARGRTDCIIIATVNNNQKTLKLTSIMRDTYVKIPGYSNNKINASYAIGGMPLLLKTIEVNFGIKLVGYVLVGFDGFEGIIDALGGVEIELTETEANYLNKTNYISNKENRDVKAGKNLMNGNQALGYSRVRYVGTGTGLANDYGRNYRQRNVLTALFTRYKDSSVTDIVTLMPKITKLITTNIDDNTIMSYIANVLTLGATEIETYKIPIDGFYKGARVRSMAVLYITDINGTRSRLHKYIFGTELDTGSTDTNYYGESYSNGSSNSGNKSTSTSNNSTTKVKEETEVKKDTTVKEVEKVKKPVVTDIPKEDETVVEEPIIDEPIIDEPIIDEPIIDEPIIDEPIIEEPTVNTEPVVEDPVTDIDKTVDKITEPTKIPQDTTIITE